MQIDNVRGWWSENIEGGTNYITDSLRNLITTGKGQSNPKEE
jgi:hypothetical protein